MEKKRLNYLYIIIVMLVCLVPLVLIKFAGMQQSTENKDKLAFPELSSKGKINSSYLTDMGAWFEENFAFRQQMVSVNGKLMSDLFGVSQTSEIVTGKDGWLFTSLSLDDYRGTNQYSDRKIFNMAHNVSLMQKSAEAQGRKFVFTVIRHQTLKGFLKSFWKWRSTMLTFTAFLKAVAKRCISRGTLIGIMMAQSLRIMQ